MKKIPTLLLLILAAIHAMGQSISIIDTYEETTPLDVKKISERGHEHNNLKTFLGYRDYLSYELLSYKSTNEIKYRLDVGEILFWDEVSSIWSAALQEEFVYNSDGIIISKLILEWDDNTNQWETTWKTTYTYDASNKLIVELESNWDDGAEQWVPVEKYENNYDASGLLILTTDYEWDEVNTQWMKELKSEYSYNTSGDLSIRQSFEWDGTGSQWVNERRNEYTYDDGKLILLKEYVWNPGANQFIENWKHEFNYNISGQLTLEFDHEWDAGSSQWVPILKEEYIYDSNGNLERNLSYEWEQGSNQWLTAGKTEHTYDNAYEFSQLILPYPLDEIVNLFHHMLLDIKAYGWDEASSNWINYFMFEFSYSEQNIGSVGEMADEQIRIYPNPAKTELNIYAAGFNIEEVILYTLTGQKIMKVRPVDGIVDISHLQAGMYIVELTIENTRIRQKLLVQR